MINNISFQGQARIDTVMPKERQLRLYDAITNPKNKAAIEQLPDDVEIKFSTTESTMKTRNKIDIDYTINKYIAEFFNGIKKIGEADVFSDPRNDSVSLNDFVNQSIEKCKNIIDSNNSNLKNQDVIYELRSKNGLVV